MSYGVLFSPAPLWLLWNRAPTAANRPASLPRSPNRPPPSAGTASSKPKEPPTTLKSKSAPPPLSIQTPPSLLTNPNPRPPSTQLATPQLRVASSRPPASPKQRSRRPPKVSISFCAPFPTPAASPPVYASMPSSKPILPAKSSPKSSLGTPSPNNSGCNSARPTQKSLILWNAGNEKIALDKSLICTTLTLVDNYVSSAGA